MFPRADRRAGHSVAEFGQEALGLPEGHVLQGRRRGLLARPGDHVLQQPPGVGLGAEHGPEQVDHGRLAGVARCGQEQAGGELVGRRRSPVLPGSDDRRRVPVRPG